MRHIITHLLEPIPRAILNPIPKVQTSSPSRKTGSAPAALTISSSSTASDRLDRYAWRQPKEDTEQYNWAFDSLLSDEKKDLIKRAKRLITLIRQKTRRRTT
jgi:hypothetical protein